jgi:hypothetical protein
VHSGERLQGASPAHVVAISLGDAWSAVAHGMGTAPTELQLPHPQRIGESGTGGLT